MMLFKGSSPRRFFLARPEQDSVEWFFCTPDGVQNVQEPPVKAGHPILVMLPDRFFFFHIPQHLQGKKRKVIHAAAELQLRHMFPAPCSGESMEVLDTGIDVLGCFRSRDLDGFVTMHKKLLLRAGAVTTPFLAGRAATVSRHIHSWTMHNNGDPRILVMENRLEYFFGDEQELELRIRDNGCSEPPAQLTISDIMQYASAAAVPWSSLRLQLPQITEVQSGSRTALKAAAVIFLTGIIFCSGELYKLQSLEQERDKWQTALEEVYTRALGPEYGPDPYGMLLYRADQAQNRRTMGVNFLEFMGRLSSAAPDNFLVHDLSLDTDSGTLQASIDSYDEMEKLLDSLSDLQGYSFTLEQADTAGDKVEITLRVRY